MEQYYKVYSSGKVVYVRKYDGNHTSIKEYLNLFNMSGSKIYNKETKNYKIDIYAKYKADKTANYLYVASTDHSKTCREAKANYIEINKEFCTDKVIMARYARKL